MKRLDVSAINLKSPYKIFETQKDGYYKFLTEHDVEYSIVFEPDELLQCCESYQFVISNVNHAKSPRDSKVRDTILLIIEDFFIQNNSTLLYICESGDGKQVLRSRLFDYWYISYQRNSSYLYMSTSVTDDDGIENFAALIVRKDNPLLNLIVSEFTETVQLLSQKP